MQSSAGSEKGAPQVDTSVADLQALMATLQVKSARLATGSAAGAAGAATGASSAPLAGPTSTRIEQLIQAMKDLTHGVFPSQQQQVLIDGVMLDELKKTFWEGREPAFKDLIRANLGAAQTLTGFFERITVVQNEGDDDDDDNDQYDEEIRQFMHEWSKPPNK